MYKSQFLKMYTYDWFCGPGSHLFLFKVYKTQTDALNIN